MRIRYLFILIALLFTFSGCSWKLKTHGDGDDSTFTEVRRYDRLECRYLTTGDYSAIQQMSTDYPIETRTLIEKMLQLGTVDDPMINTKFLHFYQDSTLQLLIADTEAAFANMDDINAELKTAFNNLSEWLPGFPVPEVYAQIGALDQSIVVSDRMIGISLDKYMGSDYPLYRKYYPAQMRKSMTRSYIAPDCLTFYLLSIYQLNNFDQRSQLDHDLQMGKAMYVVNRAIGRRQFNTPYVWVIARYMHRHKDMTIEKLMHKNDFSDIRN